MLLSERTPLPHPPAMPLTGERDTLFRGPLVSVGSFTFDESVARVFDDMIRRSVPGYATVLAMTGALAGRHVQAGSRVYDLGCALGSATLAMLPHLAERDCTLCLVDKAPAMLARGRRLFRDRRQFDLEWQLSDIVRHPLHDASFVVLNYTLQFITPGRRDALLQRIFSGMRSGGVLLLTEKCRAASPALQWRLDARYARFKRAQGYSPSEIANKRQTLERVLIPETRRAHLDRLRRSGFVNVLPWLHCLPFVSFLAHKP